MTSLAGIPKDLILDPLVTKPNPTYLLERSGKELNFQNYPCQTYSNSSIVFQINTPSNQVFVDRKMYLAMQMQTTFQTASGTGTVFPTGLTDNVCALRWYPVNSQSTNMEIQINNSSVNVNGFDYLEPLSRYCWDKEFENSWGSIGPDMHDYGTYQESYNTNLSPLANFFTNSAQQPRGAFAGTIVSQNPSNGTAVVNWQWAEPILLSPLVFSKMRTAGFFGVNTITFTFTLGNSLQNFLSYDNVNGTALAAIGGITSTILNLPPVLQVQYLSPLIPMPVQDTYLYGYSRINEFLYDIGSVGTGATQSFTTNNIQLTSVPSKIFMFVRQRNMDRSPYTPDIYAYISNANLQYLNKSGILANASPQQLYQLCSTNGFNYSWINWSQYSGSVLCFDFNKDMPLDDGYIPGLQVNMNFSASITLQNLQQVPINYTVFTVVLYDGIFSIVNGISQTVINLVEPADIAEAKVVDASQSDIVSDIAYNAIGGDFSGTLRKFGSKAKSAAKYGYSKYQQYKPEIDAAVRTAKVLGQSAAELLPLLLAAGLPHNEIRKKLKQHGYSDHQIMAAGLSGSGYSAGGLSGGQLINNPRDLLTGHQQSRPSIHNRY
jgi:hypothetical protein